MSQLTDLIEEDIMLILESIAIVETWHTQHPLKKEVQTFDKERLKFMLNLKKKYENHSNKN